MNQTPASDQKKIPFRAKLEKKIKNWLRRTKALHGEPRYVAMGMAVGIFVAATPTIPFQTLIAVAICLIVRGSKAAAAVGVWLSNPVTFPVFYLASYKIGAAIFGITNGHEISSYTVSDMLELGIDITVAAIAGGIVIGIFLGVAAYFLTYNAVTKIRSREKKHKGLLGRRRKTASRGPCGRELGAQQPSRTGDRRKPAACSAESRTKNKSQMTERTEQKIEIIQHRTDTRNKIAPALVSDPSDPTCEYSTTIFCQPVTKDQRPGT